MLAAKIYVSRTDIKAEKVTPVTAGMVGAEVDVYFGREWDGYAKTYVWEHGGVSKDDTTCSGIIPPEVVARSGGSLKFGVFGTKDGKATPTLWCTVDVVKPGADPSGDETTDPTLPVWAQLREEIEKLKQTGGGTITDEQIAAALEKYLAENPIEGISEEEVRKIIADYLEENPVQDGKPGEDGGYYTPAVTQPTDDTMQVEFTPSKADMPSVAPVTVKLPVGSGSGSSPNAELYIGPDEPTGDNRPLYWLDTSESGDSEGDSGGETEPVAYAVETNLTYVTIDNTAESVNEGESYAAAITAVEGYELSSVSITMDGVDITGTSYASGNIYIASVTGSIVITAVSVEVSDEVTTHTVTNNLVNVTSDNPAVSVEENASYKATLTPADGYRFDTVSVTMGGVDVTATVYADGAISIDAVTGVLVISAVAEEIILVDEFTADWLLKEVSNGTIPTMRVTNLETAVDEFPETLSVVAIINNDYWSSGKSVMIVYDSYSKEYLDSVETKTINVDGVSYGVLAVTKEDLSANYTSVIESGGNVNEFKIQMGNVANRFPDGVYYCYAGTVDETVIKGLFGV